MCASECECSTPVDKQFENITQLSRNIKRTIGKNEKGQSIFVALHSEYREENQKKIVYNKTNTHGANRCMFHQIFRNKRTCRLILIYNMLFFHNSCSIKYSHGTEFECRFNIRLMFKIFLIFF